jgi:MOSC domain-containing protein YiiM
MGKNIIIQGINLLSLATNTILKIGLEAEIKTSGLRNLCARLDKFQKGLAAAVLDENVNGKVIRKAGVRGIVIKSGYIKEGDTIQVTPHELPHRPLEPV